MKASSTIRFRLADRTELSAADNAEMFALLSRHFEGVTSRQFEQDLAKKNLVLLLEREDALVGFSTLQAYTTRFENESLNVIYSGDTIVTPDAWGSTALPRAWVAGVEELRKRLPTGRCFWLLLTSGFRTYRFLPVFWKEFYPRFDSSTPESMARLLVHLASAQFGSEFDAPGGIVRFRNPQRLRPGLNEVSQGRQYDPHISFFLSHNPGHVEGDELVCLTELSPDNLTAAGRRMMRRPAYAV
jgi:hypothetical protein